MLYSAVGFLLGIFIVVQIPELPTLSIWYWFGLCGLGLFLYRSGGSLQKCFLVLFAAALGFGWSCYRAEHLLNWQLPTLLENKEIMILGEVSGLPEVQPLRTRVTLKLLSVPEHPHIKLHWPRAPQLYPGDLWHLCVRLKRPHGPMNPGSFDTEKYLFFQGIRATGQVCKRGNPERIKRDPVQYPIETLRMWFKNQIASVLPHHALAQFITALTIGDGSQITKSEWDILRKTGITHLMVISGSHITLLAGFAFLLGQFFWRRMPHIPLWFSAPQAGAVFGLMVGVFYSFLAGFSIPTQRASVAIACYFLSILFKKHYTAWMLFSMALLAVLVLDPFAVMSPGFWLSFIAVALIFYGTQYRLQASHALWHFSWIQIGMALGLLPLTAYFFQKISLIGILANCIAVPWISFVVTPLALLGAACLPFLKPLSQILFSLAHGALEILWHGIVFLSQLSFSEMMMPVVHPLVLLLALLGVLLFFAPKGMYGRYLGLLYVCPLWFFPQEKPKWGEVWLTVLDVGQGLSVVAETHHHTLVYDVGPKYGGVNATKQVVQPFLHTRNVHTLDTLMISHLDSDHVGDAASLPETFVVKQVLTSEPNQIAWTNAFPCIPNQQWEWEGVRFLVLHPARFYTKRNNRSCVLKITVGPHSVLLPGDIESSVERELYTTVFKDLDVDILVAPHHGSLTSSSEAFLDATTPQHVIFSADVLNRYGLPKPAVVARYQRKGAWCYTTGKTGAITFKLKNNTPLQKPEVYRWIHRHWWWQAYGQ